MNHQTTWKLPLWLFAAAFALIAWAGAAAAFFTDAGTPVFTVALVIALVATEAAFWLGALLLGWKVFEIRKRLWSRLGGAA